MTRYRPAHRMIDHSRPAKRATIRITAVAVALFLAAVQAPPAVQQIRESEIAADFIVAVDASGSMAAGGRWEFAKNLLWSLEGSVRAADTVTIVAFDTMPRVLLRRSGAGFSAAEAVGRLPLRPDGNDTDLGAVLELTVALLGRITEARVGGVLLVTDGYHDPSSMSRYYPATVGSAWESLRQQTQVLRQSRPLVATQIDLSRRTSSGVVASVYGLAGESGPGSLGTAGALRFYQGVQQVRKVTRTVGGIARSYDRYVTSLLLLGVLLALVLESTRPAAAGPGAPRHAAVRNRSRMAPVGAASATWLGAIGVNMSTGGTLAAWFSPWWVFSGLCAAVMVWAAFASTTPDPPERPDVSRR